MLTRREWLGSGAFGAMAGDQPGGFTDAQEARIVASLSTLAAEAVTANRGCHTGACPSLAKVRDVYTAFLRANQKFPDLLDVGVDVFYDAHDWHVRNQQGLALSRLPDGRYTIGFMFTRLVLRPDASADFIGVPYDVRA